MDKGILTVQRGKGIIPCINNPVFNHGADHARDIFTGTNIQCCTSDAHNGRRMLLFSARYCPSYRSRDGALGCANNSNEDAMDLRLIKGNMAIVTKEYGSGLILMPKEKILYCTDTNRFLLRKYQLIGRVSVLVSEEEITMKQYNQHLEEFMMIDKEEGIVEVENIDQGLLKEQPKQEPAETKVLKDMLDHCEQVKNPFLGHGEIS